MLIYPTRYRSVDTLTRIRSSPMRTFSPSDLCLDAGWMVHQQASPVDTTPKIIKIKNIQDNSHGAWLLSKIKTRCFSHWFKSSRGRVRIDHTAPVECSCRPTSNDNLSVRDRDVFKHVRYWWENDFMLGWQKSPSKKMSYSFRSSCKCFSFDYLYIYFMEHIKLYCWDSPYYWKSGGVGWRDRRAGSGVHPPDPPDTHKHQIIIIYNHCPDGTHNSS